MGQDKMSQMTPEEWGDAVAQGEFDHDISDIIEEREELTEERILEMLDNRQFKELKEELENNMYPVDLAEILEGFEQKQLVMVLFMGQDKMSQMTPEEWGGRSSSRRI